MMSTQPRPKLLNYLLSNMKLGINHLNFNKSSFLLQFIEESAENPENIDILNTILKRGADVNQANKDENTPILLATIYNKMEFLKILLNTKDANLNCLNKEGVSPLIFFTKKRDLNGVLLLLENNASKTKPNPNILDNDKRNALHWAINNSSHSADASYELEETLLKYGTKVNQIDERGRVPLHYAFVKIGKPFDRSMVDPIETVANLLSRDDIKCDVADKWGNTPLTYSAQHGSIISTLTLIRSGANIDHKNKEGNTPLGVSMLSGHMNLAIFFIQKEADVKNMVSYVNWNRKIEEAKKEAERLGKLAALEPKEADSEDEDDESEDEDDTVPQWCKFYNHNSNMWEVDEQLYNQIKVFKSDKEKFDEYLKSSCPHDYQTTKEMIEMQQANPKSQNNQVKKGNCKDAGDETEKYP